jgi:hypothetical protein
MALLILNERNDLFRTAENLEDASFIISNLDYYQSLNKVIDISDQDFIDLKYNVKIFKSYDGSSVTWETNLPLQHIQSISREMLDNFTKQYIQRYDDFIRIKGTTGHPFLTKVLNAKQALQNIDTSVLTFPIESTMGNYLKSNNINFVHYTQF